MTTTHVLWRCLFCELQFTNLLAYPGADWVHTDQICEQLYADALLNGFNGKQRRAR